MILRAFLVSIGVALPCLAWAAEADLAGSWVGHWDRDGSTLEVETAFARADTGYSGNFSSTQLRVVGIPFSRIRYEPPRVSWTLVGDATTALFEGILEGNTLQGRFQDNGASGTFHLTRRASPPAAIHEEEITFQNGTVTLAGIVLRPSGPGPFPAVVFLHGSGPEGRWASRFLASAFVRNGIASLTFDKRGVGGSKGDWRQAGFEDLVGDAVAAVTALRARPGIDSMRVGIHGHSQGGTYAPWVAEESGHVAFVVGSAASGVTMAEAEVYSLSNTVGMRDLSAADRRLAERYVKAVVATAYDGAPRAELDRAAKAVRGKPWAFELPATSGHYWTFSRRIASYRPLDHWRRVKAPVMLVYGEGDQRVPPRESAARISEAYVSGGGKRLDVRFFPGADHTFRLRPRGSGTFAWPRSAPAYPDAVIEWVRDVTRIPDRER